MKKTCRIKGCYIKHQGVHFMCGKHWAMLSPALQQRIYTSYGDMREGKGSAALNQAMSDAELSISEQENKQQLTGVQHAI